MNDIYQIIEILENNPEIDQIMKNCPYEILKRWKVREFPKDYIIFHQCCGRWFAECLYHG